MAVWTQHSDDDPFFRVKGHPIRITELLVIVYVAAFVLVALSQSFGIGSWISALSLATPAVLGQGKVWQLASYPLVNPVTPWFALEMLMFFWFGREVERALGRRGFVALYAGLAVVPALVLLGLALGTHHDYFYNGSSNLHFAVFVAFAILFPETPIFFGVLAKWVAVALVALSTLIAVAHHQWADLAVLWASVGAAAAAIRIPFLSGFFEWLETRREREQARRVQQKVVERKRVEERLNQSIDPILEKISKQGMQSLNREERDRLERARLELLKRDQAAGK